MSALQRTLLVRNVITVQTFTANEIQTDQAKLEIAEALFLRVAYVVLMLGRLVHLQNSNKECP